jgi:hypothetical protein
MPMKGVLHIDAKPYVNYVHVSIHLVQHLAPQRGDRPMHH